MLRPPAAAETAPFSPVPFPFPAPAAWQVRPVASAPQAALLPAVAKAVLDAKALVRQVGVRVVVPRPAVAAAKAARPEAELLEAPVVPAVLPWVLPSALPWGAAWAFHRDRLPPWPAQRPVVWSVRAMEPL